MVDMKSKAKRQIEHKLKEVQRKYEEIKLEKDQLQQQNMLIMHDFKTLENDFKNEIDRLNFENERLRFRVGMMNDQTDGNSSNMGRMQLQENGTIDRVQSRCKVVEDIKQEIENDMNGFSNSPVKNKLETKSSIITNDEKDVLLKAISKLLRPNYDSKKCSLYLENVDLSGHFGRLIAGLKHNSIIKELNLTNCCLNDQMLKKFVSLMKDDTFISILKIGYNKFTTKGVERLMQMIMTNKTIQVIDVSNLEFSDESWSMMEESTKFKGITMKE